MTQKKQKTKKEKQTDAHLRFNKRRCGNTSCNTSTKEAEAKDVKLSERSCLKGVRQNMGKKTYTHQCTRHTQHICKNTNSDLSVVLAT